MEQTTREIYFINFFIIHVCLYGPVETDCNAVVAVCVIVNKYTFFRLILRMFCLKKYPRSDGKIRFLH